VKFKFNQMKNKAYVRTVLKYMWKIVETGDRLISLTHIYMITHSNHLALYRHFNKRSLVR